MMSDHMERQDNFVQPRDAKQPAVEVEADRAVAYSEGYEDGVRDAQRQQKPISGQTVASQENKSLGSKVWESVAGKPTTATEENTHRKFGDMVNDMVQETAGDVQLPVLEGEKVVENKEHEPATVHLHDITAEAPVDQPADRSTMAKAGDAVSDAASRTQQAASDAAQRTQQTASEMAEGAQESTQSTVEYIKDSAAGIYNKAKATLGLQTNDASTVGESVAASDKPLAPTSQADSVAASQQPNDGSQPTGIIGAISSAATAVKKTVFGDSTSAVETVKHHAAAVTQVGTSDDRSKMVGPIRGVASDDGNPKSGGAMDSTTQHPTSQLQSDGEQRKVGAAATHSFSDAPAGAIGGNDASHAAPANTNPGGTSVMESMSAMADSAKKAVFGDSTSAVERPQSHHASVLAGIETSDNKPKFVGPKRGVATEDGNPSSTYSSKVSYTPSAPVIIEQPHRTHQSAGVHAPAQPQHADHKSSGLFGGLFDSVRDSFVAFRDRDPRDFGTNEPAAHRAFRTYNAGPGALDAVRDYTAQTGEWMREKVHETGDWIEGKSQEAYGSAQHAVDNGRPENDFGTLEPAAHRAFRNQTLSPAAPSVLDSVRDAAQRTTDWVQGKTRETEDWVQHRSNEAYNSATHRAANFADNVVKPNSDRAADATKQYADSAAHWVDRRADDARDAAHSTADAMKRRAGETEPSAYNRARDSMHDTAEQAKHESQRTWGWFASKSDQARHAAGDAERDAADRAHRAEGWARQTAQEVEDSARRGLRRASDDVNAAVHWTEDKLQEATAAGRNTAQQTGRWFEHKTDETAEAARRNAAWTQDKANETAASMQDNANRTAQWAGDKAGEMGRAAEDSAQRTAGWAQQKANETASVFDTGRPGHHDIDKDATHRDTPEGYAAWYQQKNNERQDPGQTTSAPLTPENKFSPDHQHATKVGEIMTSGLAANPDGRDIHSGKPTQTHQFTEPADVMQKTAGGVYNFFSGAWDKVTGGHDARRDR